MVDKDILKFVQSSENIIDTDSDDENEMSNAAPVPPSFEMRNIMKIAHIEAPVAWGPRIIDTADNTVPKHTCTPKYCGVLSSDITLATFDCEKTQRLDTCKPVTPSLIRESQKKPLPSQEHGLEGDSVENIEENGCVASSPSQIIYSEH
ncbi:hypothetical protein TNCV_1620251 [Trichonephila clavipes]|nr:hypothetical protein TNCV_1620251 [Trichonephila clavipes]